MSGEELLGFRVGTHDLSSQGSGATIGWWGRASSPSDGVGRDAPARFSQVACEPGDVPRNREYFLPDGSTCRLRVSATGTVQNDRSHQQEEQFRFTPVCSAVQDPHQALDHSIDRLFHLEQGVARLVELVSL